MALFAHVARDHHMVCRQFSCPGKESVDNIRSYRGAVHRHQEKAVDLALHCLYSRLDR